MVDPRPLTTGEIATVYAAFALDFVTTPESWPVFRSWIASIGRDDDPGRRLLLGEPREAVAKLAQLNLWHLKEELSR